MKKIYTLLKAALTLCLMAVAGVTVSAEEVVYTPSEQSYENAQDIASWESAPVTVTFDAGGNNNGPKYYTNGTAIRMYANNTMTVSLAEGYHLVSITANVNNMKNGGLWAPGVTSDDDAIKANGEYTWTPANETTTEATYTVSSTASSQARVASLTIVYVANGSDVVIIDKPKASVPSGVYYEAQTVELTCGTEGATIQYQIDGEGFEPYTAPITIDASCKLEAKAVLGDKESDVVTYTYTIAQTKTVTVEEALAIIAELENRAVTTDRYIISSTIESITQNFGTSWGTAEFTLQGGLVAFRLNYLDNQPEKEEAKLHVGDEVKVIGQLQKYDEKPELVNGYIMEHTIPANLVEAPVATPGAGAYTEAQTVTLTCATEGASILYQIDGEGFEPYTEPIIIAATCRLDAKAVKGDAESEVATFEYIILEAEEGNLLINGNFEAWEGDQPVNWKSTCTASSATLSKSEEAHGGSFAVKVGGNASSNKRLAYKELDLEEGKYTFTCYVKATTDDAARCETGYVPVKDGAAVSNAYTYASGYVDINNTEWTLITAEFTLSEPTTVCLLVMNPKSATVKKTVEDEEVTTEYVAQDILVDDARLVKEEGGEPEPDPEFKGRVTIADFLAAADEVNIYELEGVVSDIANTTYGNFNLTDATGTVYIYGLLDLEGNAKNFASLGIEEKDTVTLRGTYTTHNDAPQIANAQFVSVKKFVPEPVAVDAPVASVPAGVYYEPIEVELTCATEGATIMYSINEAEFQAYTTAIAINANSTLKAYAQLGEDKSEEATFEYVIKTIVEDNNLLANGDFETWEDVDGTMVATNWVTASTAGNAKLTQSTDAHAGAYAIEAASTGSNTRLGYKETTLKAGTYTFAIYAKNAEAEKAAVIALGYATITDAGKTDKYVYSDVINVTDGWTRYVYEFTLTEETTISLVARINKNTANVLFDDAILTTEDGGIISAINAVEADAKAEGIYTLTGVKVQTPVKGLNIINGRKVMVK